MRLLVAVIDGSSIQQEAERVAAVVESHIQCECLFSGIVAVTLFDSEKCEPKVLSAEFIKRYNRVNVDLEVDFRSYLDSPERIGSLIESAVRYGLKKAGFEAASASVFPQVRIVPPVHRKQTGGLYTLSVFSSPAGVSSQCALGMVRDWIATADGVFEDGEVELNQSELHAYIFCPRAKLKSLQAFVSREFQRNGILLVDADDKVVCQW